MPTHAYSIIIRMLCTMHTLTCVRACITCSCCCLLLVVVPGSVVESCSSRQLHSLSMLSPFFFLLPFLFSSIVVHYFDLLLRGVGQLIRRQILFLAARNCTIHRSRFTMMCIWLILFSLSSSPLSSFWQQLVWYVLVVVVTANHILIINIITKKNSVVWCDMLLFFLCTVFCWSFLFFLLHYI